MLQGEETIPKVGVSLPISCLKKLISTGGMKVYYTRPDSQKAWVGCLTLSEKTCYLGFSVEDSNFIIKVMMDKCEILFASNSKKASHCETSSIANFQEMQLI